jgi:ankyrin repeat protein
MYDLLDVVLVLVLNMPQTTTGVNPICVLQRNSTPLHLACSIKAIPAARTLIKAGAAMDIVDNVSIGI